MYRAKSTHKTSMFRTEKQPSSSKAAPDLPDGPLVTTAIN
jgi:hypothetical protein